MGISLDMISMKTLFVLFLQAVVIWWLLQGLRLLLSLFRKEKVEKHTPFYFPIVSSIIWLIYWFYVLVYLLESSLFTTFIVLIVLLLLARRSLQSFMSGLLFRIYRGDITGAYIEIEKQKGVIESWGAFQFCIKTKKDKLVYIPYDKAFSSILIQSNMKTESNVTSWSMCLDGSFMPELVERQLRKKIGEIPWIIECKDIVFLEGDKDNTRELKVVYVLSEEDRNIQVKEQLTNFMRKVVKY